MYDRTLTHYDLSRIINEAQPIYLDHSGNETNKAYVLDQMKEGWRIGVVTQPISNAITAFWIVATAHHKDHYGFDAGECVEAVEHYMDDADFIENWSESGGGVFEVEGD